MIVVNYPRSTVDLF